MYKRQQQETVKAYSGMTSQEVISAISAKGISSSQYADVYDNYDVKKPDRPVKQRDRAF